ncbi:5426_t:CDS:2, partial [Ambispora gerdemannii]
MIGNGPPLFTGKAEEDLSNWILEFKRFVIASRINIIVGVGGVTGRAKAYNLGISCMIDEAKIWYENEIKNRNWQCNNILDSTDVNDLNAIRALNNDALTGINANQFLGEVLIVRNNTGSDNTITSANIIPVGTWDEDWSIAGGHPAPIETPFPTNYANAGTVEAQKNFFSSVRLRKKYIQKLNPINQYNVCIITKYHDTRDNIIKALVEAEKFSLLQGNFLFPPSGSQ